MKRALIWLSALTIISGTASHVGAGVIVTAHPIWTDTGLILSSGDIVNITASGVWSYGGPSVGPDGDSGGCDCSWDLFEIFDDHDFGRLIGYVGVDPFQGNWGNGGFFPQLSGYISIGSGVTFTATTSGELWLGINDDAVSEGDSDNSGSLMAEINVYSDSDGDGVPDVQDCAPLDPSAYSVPAEVTGDQIASDEVTFSWYSAAPGAGSGMVYDVIRGVLNELPVGAGGSETCTGAEVLGTTSSDTTVPTAGNGFWYLVRGHNVCGAGTYGFASDGVERVTTACP